MEATLSLSEATRGTAGILLLTIVGVEWGGAFMLRLVRGSQPATDFQRSFFRAGHAHAGMLVTLALVCLLFADAVHMNATLALLARNGVWAAAILMPAGFFFSAAGRDVRKPNAFIALVYVGAAALAAGVIALGIGLLAS